MIMGVKKDSKDFSWALAMSCPLRLYEYIVFSVLEKKTTAASGLEVMMTYMGRSVLL